MMISKLKTPGAVGGLLAGLVLGTALAAVFSATPPSMAQAQKPEAPALAAPKQQDMNKALAEDQLKLAREALDTIDALRRNARIDAVDPRVAVWERRRIEALQASGIGRGELVLALEKYVERMKNLVQYAERRREEARITQVDVLDWQYRVLEGEMWLNEVKSR
jgi:Spy/CpxP family protein refolding chaperone